MTEDNMVFEFKHTDSDGGVNVLKFNAETWTEALEKFVQFLRGSGYFLEYDSIGINAERHPHAYSDLLQCFYPGDSRDASQDEIEIPWDMGFPGISEDMIPQQGCNNNRFFNCNQQGG